MSAINEWNKDGPDYPSDEERCDEGFCHIAEARGEQYRCQGNCAYKGTAPTPPGATPRTDALLLEINEGRVYETVGPVTELCRQLERELASTSARVGELGRLVDELQAANGRQVDWIADLTNDIVSMRKESIEQEHRTLAFARRAEQAEQRVGELRERLHEIEQADFSDLRAAEQTAERLRDELEKARADTQRWRNDALETAAKIAERYDCSPDVAGDIRALIKEPK